MSRTNAFENGLRWWPIERQNMFTDAVFSIAATIAVANLEIKKTDPETEDFLLKTALQENIPKFVAYFACFFVISTYWGCHVRLYNLVIHSNDVLTWLNLVLLCALSFLPLTLSLWAETVSYKNYMSHFPAINLALVCFILTVTILYVFREEVSHHTNITDTHKSQRRFIIMMYAWFPTLIGVFCVYIYKLQELALSLVFLLVLLTALAVTMFERWYLGQRLLDIAFQQVQSPLPLERIEAFSDGVYAISMTLMAVQTAEKMSSHASHDKFLEIFGNSSAAYITAFGQVSVLWFIHHQLCHNIEQSNPMIQVLNTLALSCVGGVPFSTGLLQYYTNPHNFSSSHYRANEKAAVRFHCAILFLSGFYQALFWLAAIFMRVTNVDYETRADALLLFKAMVVPTISTIVYIDSLFYQHSGILFLILTITIPFIFGVANFCHRRQKSIAALFLRLSRKGKSENEGLSEEGASQYLHPGEDTYSSFSARSVQSAGQPAV